MRTCLQAHLAVIIILITPTDTVAQKVYSDTTAIPGISFELHGAYALEKNDLVVAKTTSIRFVRKGDVVPANFEYSINGSKAVLYTGAFRIERAGVYNVGYRLLEDDRESTQFYITLVVDDESPVITASIIYKSITLKQLTFGDSKVQNGTKKFECPLGSEISITAKDNVFSSQNVFLKEGKASYKVLEGRIGLRSKGTHRYVIMAQDFVGNVIETAPIELEIIER